MEGTRLRKTELSSSAHADEQSMHPTGHLLEWKGVTCTTKDGSRTLLNQVSGVALPGEILGIVGWKCCLFDRLTQPNPDVFLNGTCTTGLDYLSQISVCDHPFKTSTLWEMMKFSLDVRTQYSEAEKTAKIELILSELELTEYAHSVIDHCDSITRDRGIIGSELVVEPPIFILNRYLSASLVRLLKAHAVKGNTVIILCLPKDPILRDLDRVLLLSADSVVYQGSPANIQSHFESLGFPFPEEKEFGETLSSLLSVTDPMTEAESSRLQVMKKGYVDAEPSTKNYALKLRVPPSDLTKMHYLLKRELKHRWRTMDLFAWVFELIVVSLISMMITSYNDTLEFTPLITTTGFMFYIGSFQLLAGCYNALGSMSIFDDRAVYYKESKRGLYSSFLIYLSRSAADLPALFPISLTYTIGVYWKFDLIDSSNLMNFLVFGIDYLAIILLTCRVCGTGCGYLGTSFIKPHLAQVTPSLVHQGVASLFLVFSYRVPLVQYISPTTYIFQIMVTSQVAREEAEALQLPTFDDVSILRPLACLFALTIAVRVLVGFILARKYRK